MFQVGTGIDNTWKQEIEGAVCRWREDTGQSLEQAPALRCRWHGLADTVGRYEERNVMLVLTCIVIKTAGLDIFLIQLISLLGRPNNTLTNMWEGVCWVE